MRRPQVILLARTHPEPKPGKNAQRAMPNVESAITGVTAAATNVPTTPNAVLRPNVASLVQTDAMSAGPIVIVPRTKTPVPTSPAWMQTAATPIPPRLSAQHPC